MKLGITFDYRKIQQGAYRYLQNGDKILFKKKFFFFRKTE